MGYASGFASLLDGRQGEPAVPRLVEDFLSPPTAGLLIQRTLANRGRRAVAAAPVNSLFELGGAEVGLDGGAGAGVSAMKQDDAVYQAFVR